MMTNNNLFDILQAAILIIGLTLIAVVVIRIRFQRMSNEQRTVRHLRQCTENLTESYQDVFIRMRERLERECERTDMFQLPVPGTCDNIHSDQGGNG